MGTNKIILAILFGVFAICLTIYLVGNKSVKTPQITNPTNGESQTTVTPNTEVSITPPSVSSPTAVVEDLSPIAAGIAKEFGTDPAIYIITKGKQLGDYAIGGVTEKGAEAGGAQWWGVKQEGVWKYIFSGQSYPKCSVIVSYQIPKELLDSCFDAANNLIER